MDVDLDIENTELSPGVRRMLAMVGHEMPFEQGREQMKLLAGLSANTKAVERTAEAIGADTEVREQRQLKQAMQLNLPIPIGPRIPVIYVEMDGTGVPVVRKETQGRAGKQDGQPAHTREVKLGCFFTQTTVDAEGYPIRDEDSTSYVGAIESCEEFGRRLYAENVAAGLGRGRQKSSAGRRLRMDLESGRLHFPDATFIVDKYHSREHLWILAGKVYPQDEPARKRWVMVGQDKLDEGKIEEIVATLRCPEAAHSGLVEDIEKEVNYFEANQRAHAQCRVSQARVILSAPESSKLVAKL